jgi:hypothetical protein
LQEVVLVSRTEQHREICKRQALRRTAFAACQDDLSFVHGEAKRRLN